MVSASTVGYGDIYPHTAVGRIAAGVIILSGIVLAAFLTGSLANTMAPTEFHEKVLQFMERDKLRVEQQTLAAIIIQTAWKSFKKHIRDMNVFFIRDEFGSINWKESSKRRKIERENRRLDLLPIKQLARRLRRSRFLFLVHLYFL